MRFKSLLFVLLAAQSVALAAVPYPPPTTWKGINYSPRRHSYFKMLYDWNQTDGTQLVSTMAENDLTTLAQNGFNLVHLYIWDQDWLRAANANEPSGFVNAAGDPSQSPNNQWNNLNDFVTKAENHGLFVALHFASGWILNNINTANAATTYSQWVGKFIQFLNSTHTHQNVLLWGTATSLDPVIGDACYPNGNPYSKVWTSVYQQVDTISRQYSPHPGVLGLIGVDLSMGINGASGVMISRGSGYVWNWQTAQQTAYTMRQLLTCAYGSTKDPDNYLMLMYQPNSSDTFLALSNLITNNTVQNGLPVQASKVFITETATSSDLGNSAPQGTNVPSYGDNNTAVTTVSGQSSWTQNTFCILKNAGIQKYAYWAMYDPYTLWSTYPWSKTGTALSWDGFWGLAFEPESGGNKASWSILQQYYLNGSLSCGFPFAPGNFAPIMSITLGDTFFTVAQPIKVTWTAAEAASLSLNSGNNGTYACDNGNTLSSTTLLPASCAYTSTTYSTTGNKTLTITGTSVGGTQASASTPITIGAAPIVNAVTNQSYSSTIHVNDTMIVWGNGFSITGGNTLVLARSGYADVWYYEGNPTNYWDYSYYQINAPLGGRAAAGIWTLYVRNPYDGTPSAGFQVTLVP